MDAKTKGKIPTAINQIAYERFDSPINQNNQNIGDNLTLAKSKAPVTINKEA
jgi:hypothetical protein